MLNSRVLYIIIIIIIIIVTIIIVIYVIIQYRANNSNATTFTYGDVVTIQSLATNQYVTPGCSYVYVPQGNGISGILPNSNVSFLSASSTDSASQNLIKWEVIVPPTPTEGNPQKSGYAFRNKLTGQYMVIPIQQGFDPNDSARGLIGGLVVALSAQSFNDPIVNPTPTTSTIDPNLIYENRDNNFLFQIGSPNIKESLVDSGGIYTITHSFSDGIVVVLATSGLPNQSVDSSKCIGIDTGSIPFTACQTNPCNLGCPQGSSACIQYLPFGTINSPLYTKEQFLFKIIKASN